MLFSSSEGSSGGSTGGCPYPTVSSGSGQSSGCVQWSVGAVSIVFCMGFERDFTGGSQVDSGEGSPIEGARIAEKPREKCYFHQIGGPPTSHFLPSALSSDSGVTKVRFVRKRAGSRVESVESLDWVSTALGRAPTAGLSTPSGPHGFDWRIAGFLSVCGAPCAENGGCGPPGWVAVWSQNRLFPQS